MGMRSHHHGFPRTAGVQGLLLGSETQKVLTHSKIPGWCTGEQV
jgi:hypothetical protein